MNARILLLCTLLLLFGMVAACSEDDNPAPTDGDTDAVDVVEQDEAADIIDETETDVEAEADMEDAADGDMDEESVPEQEERIDQEPVDYSCPGGVKVVSIGGSAVDDDGNGMSGVIVIACLGFPDGGETCLNPVWSGDDGGFTVTVPASKQCVSRVALRALTGQDDKLIVACPLDTGDGGDIDLPDPLRILTMPEPTRQSLGDTSVPHTVSIDDGATLTIIPDDIDSYDYGYEQTRLLAWDADAYGWPCFIDAENPPLALYALLPEVNISGPDGAHMTFPNTAGLDAGARVTVYALGGVGTHLFDDTPVKEGRWVAVGSATVSADGMTISTDAGKGLPFLTWTGYYPAP